MSVLHRKLVREIGQRKGQALAIIVVIASGVAVAVMSFSNLDTLTAAADDYYERTRFADVFASTRRAPREVTARLREIPGVAAVETRVVGDVTIDLPDFPDPVTARLVSLPPGLQPALNRVHLRQGRLPEQPDEALVGEAFAQAHAFQPGDSLTAIINGRRQRLQIVGIALSPEFVYTLQPGALFPDERRYGILWLPEPAVAAAFDLEGAFNDVALRLARSARTAAVIDAVDRLLEPYGGLGALPRAEQVSHWYLHGELEQLRTMGLFVPLIFLGVAAFLMNLVLGRLVGTQREQIAILGAFGYAPHVIGAHFLAHGVLIALAGGGAGIALGAWLGAGMSAIYGRFYRFPELDYHLEPTVWAGALLASLGCALVGAAAAVRRAATLPPAEGMRPEAPESYRVTILERLGWQQRLAIPARMVIRGLERHRMKSLMVLLGIGMAVAVQVVGLFMYDAIDRVVALQFGQALREQLTVSFTEPVGPRALHELERLPGVRRVEGVRLVPARLVHGHRARRVMLHGVAEGAELHRIVDRSGRCVEAPASGLLVSRRLAEVLGAGPGDRITVEVLEGQRPVLEIPIGAEVEDLFGLTAYLEAGQLARALGELPQISAAYLGVADPRMETALHATLEERPRVAAVSLTRAAYDNFRSTLAENLLQMTLFNVLFASAIACGVMYNSARIRLSERNRELATLRVLGFTRREVSTILLGELAVLTTAALPLGCALGYGLAALLAGSLDTEVYRIPLVILPRTYAFSCAVVGIAAFLSGWWVRRHLGRLDLMAVLKARE